MKATIDTGQLREAFKKVCMVQVKRQLPVLSYIKLEITDGTAKLTVNDLEKAIRYEIEAKSDEAFTALLPRKSTQVFLTGKNGKLSVERAGNTLTLERGEFGKYKTNAGKVEDFPPIPQPSSDIAWSAIDARWFCPMLGILITACAKEESRPVLTGVVFKDGSMASADGFRLVVVDIDKLSFGLGDKEAIVSYQTLDIVRRLFAKEDTMEIGFDLPKSQVYFKAGHAYLVSQLIQGTFPNWKVLIPDKHICRVSFSTPLMLQRLGMIDPPLSGITRLQFQRTEIGEPECVISAKGGDDGEDYYESRMPVTIETEAVARIAVNYKYLCDALKPFSVCNLELTSESSPLKLTGDIEGLTIVVMPMFIQW